jgi:hypothetical protein
MVAGFPAASRSAQCGYAAIEGTILMLEDWFLNTVRTLRAIAANRPAMGQESGVRQRIAAGRRHIAPALLLC